PDHAGHDANDAQVPGLVLVNAVALGQPDDQRESNDQADRRQHAVGVEGEMSELQQAREQESGCGLLTQCSKTGGKQNSKAKNKRPTRGAVRWAVYEPVVRQWEPAD